MLTKKNANLDKEAKAYAKSIWDSVDTGEKTNTNSKCWKGVPACNCLDNPDYSCKYWNTYYDGRLG